MNILCIIFFIILILASLAYWTRNETREKLKERLREKYGEESVKDILMKKHISKSEKIIREMPVKYIKIHSSVSIILGILGILVFVLAIFGSIPFNFFAIILITFMVWRNIPRINKKIRGWLQKA